MSQVNINNTLFFQDLIDWSIFLLNIIAENTNNEAKENFRIKAFVLSISQNIRDM